MRLRQFHLVRYGRFTDFSIDFGEPRQGGPDLHIIFGENEAGKSTTFNAYLDFLFGIEERSKFNFLHGYGELRVGAVLEIDGQEVQLARIKRRDASLLGAADQPVDPAALTLALHGLSRDAYQTMFSLNDETLVQGGEEILASKGDLGRLLFSATAGLSELSDELYALRERTAKFHEPRSRSSELKTLKDELGQLEEQRRALDTQASAFETLTGQRRQAEEAYQQARRRSDEIRKEQLRLTALEDAFAIRADMTALEDELKPLAHLPAPPEGWSVDVIALKQASAGALASQENARADIEAEDQKLATLETDPEIIAACDTILALERAAARHQAACEDLPQRQDELGKIDAHIEEIRARLGAQDIADLTGIIVADDKLMLFDDLLAQEPELTQKLAGAREEAFNAEEAVATAEEHLSTVTAPDETTIALSSLLDTVQKDDTQSRLQQLEDELCELQNSTAQTLRTLRPWSGTAEDLMSCALPSSQQAGRWREAAQRLTRDLDHLRKRHAEHTETRARHTSILTGLSRQSGLISDADALDARQRRDKAWAVHRAQLDHQTADAFASALFDDDRIQDQRLAAADKLAQMRARKTEIAAEDTTLAELADQIAAAHEAFNSLHQEIAPLLEAAGLPADFPAEELPDWLERAQSVHAEILKAKNLRAKRDRAIAEHTRQRSSLATALVALDEQPVQDLTFDQLRLKVQILRDRAIENRVKFEAAQKALFLAKEQRRTRSRVLSQAKQAYADWQLRWVKAFEGLWLAERDPRQMRALLKPLRDLAAQAGRRRELICKIETMETECSTFKNSIAQLATQLELADNHDAAVTFERLRARLKHAEQAATEYRTAIQTRAKAEKRLGKASSELSRIAQRMQEMAAHFPASEIITNLDDLADSLTRSEDKVKIVDKLKQKERAFMQRLGAENCQAAEAQLEAAETPFEVTKRLAQIENDLDEANSDREQRFSARQDALKAIEAIGGDSAAALLDEQRRGVLLEISEKAQRAIALQLGVMAADRALAVYRDRHRSNLMARTAEAFRTITNGDFADVKTQPDKAGDRLIALRSQAQGAGSIGAEEMSKGSRFQLYLALRLAGYRQFCEEKGPLPFIGDDIMETFDDRRAAAAIRLLGEISQHGQALYFTHHNHLCELAKRELGERVVIHEIPKQLH
ncbi:MAG: AAA family ATPase [Pseudomonadota bacterium]